MAGAALVRKTSSKETEGEEMTDKKSGAFVHIFNCVAVNDMR
jgi:hypothetical protein